MMPESSSATPRRRKQRVGVACDFCRHRKLGCNNVKPKCENCQVYNKECKYAARVQKERPSNARIDKLLIENSRLRKELARVSASGTEGTGDSSVQALDMAVSGMRYQGHESRSQSSNSSICPNQGLALGAQFHEGNFHGPTSALHGQRTGPVSDDGDGVIEVPDTEQKLHLLAQTARQRQLESIDFRSRKLDFDGHDPDLGLQLLSIFWNRQHAHGPVVYRPCFTRDMANHGPYFSKLLLNAIFFVASKHAPGIDGLSSQKDNCANGIPFRSRFEDLLHDPKDRLICNSSKTTAQALLLMSEALFTWCDERSLSWHYLGVAINMIIDMGLHSRTTPSEKYAPEGIEVHRRLLWAAFVLDKMQSIFQGRPCRLRYTDISAPLVFSDEYEELEPFDSFGYRESHNPGSGLPTHSVSTFGEYCKLGVIADDILSTLYSEKSYTAQSERVSWKLQSIKSDLQQWRMSLPSHLLIVSDHSAGTPGSTNDVVLPHIISLWLMFYALIILLHRPFIPDGHDKGIAATTAQESLRVCETTASDINVLLHLYKQHWCIKSPPYFLSYAAYVSATIHVRIAAQNLPGSRAHQNLHTCLEVLAVHQQVCRAPAQAMRVLLSMMRRLHVNVGTDFAVVSNFRTCSAPESTSASASVVTPDSEVALAGSRKTLLDTLAAETLSGPSQYGQQVAGITDTGPGTYGWDEVLADMSFDFDPLFGLVNTELYLE